MSEDRVTCPHCEDHDLLCESADGSTQYGFAPQIEGDVDGAYFPLPRNLTVYCPDCGEVTAHEVSERDEDHWHRELGLRSLRAGF
jgi:sarcosine oxidase delta subunit